MGDVELGGRNPNPKVDEHHDDNGEEHSKVTHCGSDLGRETGAERGQDTRWETWGHPQSWDGLIPKIPPLRGHAANSLVWMLVPCWRSGDLVWDSRESLIRGKIQILIQILTEVLKMRKGATLLGKMGIRH